MLFPSPEFDDAVAATCHGVADEEQLGVLNELLRTDKRARDEYIIRVELHARLASMPDILAPVAEEPATASMAVSDSRGTSNPSRTTTPEAKLSKNRVQWLALAACLVLIAIGSWDLWTRRTRNSTGATSDAVAMLARAVDAHWGRNTQQLRAGSPLGPGKLWLESGLAQIVFYNGARVVIEGPTELQLISSSEAFCPNGRVLAEVPEPAHGFRLRTPQLDVVDLGTSFGIDTLSGRSELDVFKGKVEFSNGSGAKQPLLEGSAAVAHTGAPLQFTDASSSAFSSMLDLQERSLSSEAIRYDRWRVANALRSQDPSLVVHLDLENINDLDWTLQNATAENHSVSDAAIVGCQPARGRWTDKQALEFQSVNDRVRLAVPGSFESLTLAVWVCVRGLDRQLNSLFMCDGFEPGTIHWMIRQDGDLVLTVAGSSARNSQIITSPRLLTLDKIGSWTHLAVVIDGKTKQVTHYVNGVPVASHALRLGPPYRVGSAELGNWNAEKPDPAPALIRNLSGSIDEFELFSRALTETQLQDLYEEGKPQLEL